MVVVIDLILGSFAERFGDVTVEIKILHLVAQVPEVKVSLPPNNNLLRGRGAPVSARPFGER